MIPFLEENWQSISMLIGGIVAWIFKIPISKWVLAQSKADVKATESNTDTNTINNLEKSMNIYIAIIDDINTRMKDLQDQLKEKDALIEELYMEIKELKNQVEDLVNKLEN